MKVMHQALISVRTFASENVDQISKVIKALNEKGEVLKASSVFRVRKKLKQPNHIHDLRNESRFSGLCVAIKFQTTLEAKDLLGFLQTIEGENEGEVLNKTLSLNLLTFDDYTCMTPWMTLPHPEFHRRPEEVVPAAEIWGEYIHPVLSDSLRNLIKGFAKEDWGEFYAQGKSVLDF